MKVLITPDVDGWAIGNITDGIIKHSKRFEFIKIPVHPRGLGESFLALREALNHEIDLWHSMYWNSGLQMIEALPELNNIPSLLSHHNHESIEKKDWSDFKGQICMTEWQKDILKKKYKKVYKIPHCIDLDRFSFIKEYPPKEPMVGYVGRVVPWKHLGDICEVSKRLGYKVIGSGYIDKPDYWETVPKDNLVFNGGAGRCNMASAQQKDALYEKMTVFVMYSTDEKESGTLPLLEAMARGIPIMATRQGTARDIIKDGVNGILFEPEEFEAKLDMLMKDEELRLKLRKNAWETIKNFSEERSSREYEKVYYDILYPDQDLISVIIPTCDRPETLWDIIESIDSQSYDAKEIIIVDDGKERCTETKEVVMLAKKNIKTPILYLQTNNPKGYYGLAMARNMGAIEALGHILLFLDDRYKLEVDCLAEVAKMPKEKSFMFGQKIIKGEESSKETFIENFSWIRKKDFMFAGMFCERLNMYGGLSQETRTRFTEQGFLMAQNKLAKCTEIVRSSRNKKKHEIWRAKHLLYKMYE